MVRMSKRAAFYAMTVLPLSLSACVAQSFPQADCTRINVTANGKPVVGIEDIAYDKSGAVLYLSAYDRRTHDFGGIYGLHLDQANAQINTATPAAAATIIEGVRPHGIDFIRSDRGAVLGFIDRQGTKLDNAPVIRFISLQDDKETAYSERQPISGPEFCASNDIALTSSDILFVTQDHKTCTKKTQFIENIFASGSSRLLSLSTKPNTEKTDTILAIKGLHFANGVVISGDARRIHVSETRKKRVAVFDVPENLSQNQNLPQKSSFRIKLAGGPDNLTRDGFRIYAALIPSLLRFARFQKNPKKRIESRFAIIARDNSVMTYDVPANILSGATTAIQAGEHIWLGAGYDTAIARCSLPKRAL